VRLKIITTLDHSLLRSYIHEWQLCEHLFSLCQKHGTHMSETVVDRSGNAHQVNIKRAPWDTSLAQHQTILRGIRSDLGFTPTARTKVSTVDDEEPRKADLLAFDGGKK
jgi:P27 family predicted phage terminase small subunit